MRLVLVVAPFAVLAGLTGACAAGAGDLWPRSADATAAPVGRLGNPASPTVASDPAAGGVRLADAVRGARTLSRAAAGDAAAVGRSSGVEADAVGRAGAGDADSVAPSPVDPAELAVGSERVAGGLTRPVALAAAGDGSGRLFVVEKAGRVRIVADGRVLPRPFLDLRDRVDDDAYEQGLLGIAFHPEFAANGLLFVHYTTVGGSGGLEDGDTVVSRFRVTADPDAADPASERRVITFTQPYANHNGGHLAFGPDGYLYIGTGDGGSAGDPENRAQDLGELLGKMLRIDVDTLDPARPYAIPPDNPFFDDMRARPEIWAFGLRNPWRYSFDPATGDLYVGDVGQAKWEEIHVQSAAGAGGENYGWPIVEAAECYRPAEGCSQAGLAPPVAFYSHADGTAVTGGEVYRGRRERRLFGTYVYADYGSGRVWALNRDAAGRWRNAEVGLIEGGPAAFARGDDGEVYVALDRAGEVHRIVDASNAAGPRSTATPSAGRPTEPRD